MPRVASARSPERSATRWVISFAESHRVLLRRESAIPIPTAVPTAMPIHIFAAWLDAASIFSGDAILCLRCGTQQSDLRIQLGQSRAGSREYMRHSSRVVVY